MRTVAPLVVALAVHARAAPWSARTVVQYQRERAGRLPTLWHGGGCLRNTLTGERIAHVECAELVRADPRAADGAAYRSERVILYRSDNGTLLTRSAAQRPVPALRYAHGVELSSHGDQVVLRASDGAGREVARATASRAQTRRVGFLGLSRVYELELRLAPNKPPKARPPRTRASGGARQKASPRARASSTRVEDVPVPPIPAAAGSTREEYVLASSPWPWRRRTLTYRRTGKCPTWCGNGVCTLELASQRYRPRDAVARRLWAQMCEEAEGAPDRAGG